MTRVNNKAVSDEELIAAILQHGTIKAAAEAAGIAPRTVYDRMNARAFRSAYMAAKDDIIRQAVFSINGKLSAAVDVVNEIMTDKENSPAVRLQAAQMILTHAGKFAERLARDENLSRNEAKRPFDLSLD